MGNSTASRDFAEQFESVFGIPGRTSHNNDGILYRAARADLLYGVSYSAQSVAGLDARIKRDTTIPYTNNTFQR